MLQKDGEQPSKAFEADSMQVEDQLEVVGEKSNQKTPKRTRNLFKKPVIKRNPMKAKQNLGMRKEVTGKRKVQIIDEDMVDIEVTETV